MRKAIVTNERVQIVDTRFYKITDGHYVPSVTEILSYGHAPGLQLWIENTPKEERSRAIAEGLDRGNAVHNALEVVLSGGSVSIDDMKIDEYSMVMRGINIIKGMSLTPVWIEVQFASDRLGYGGTADLVAKDQEGVVYLLDWKTNKYPDEDKWMAQLYAYKRGLLDQHGIAVDRCAIVHLNSSVRTEKVNQGPGWKLYFMDDEDSARADFELCYANFKRWGKVNPKEYTLPIRLSL